MAWWFLAIVCLIVWALIAAAKFGLVTLNGGLGALFTGWQLGRLKVLGIYLAVASLITFGVFAWDKHVAAKGDDHGRRVPEACLLGLSLAGGALGGLLAMHVVRHKTQKWYFVWGLPVIMVVDAVLILYVHLCGLV